MAGKCFAISSRLSLPLVDALRGGAASAGAESARAGDSLRMVHLEMDFQLRRRIDRRSRVFRGQWAIGTHKSRLSAYLTITCRRGVEARSGQSQPCPVTGFPNKRGLMGTCDTDKVDKNAKSLNNPAPTPGKGLRSIIQNAPPGIVLGCALLSA
jgi:hypothetical protein